MANNCFWGNDLPVWSPVVGSISRNAAFPGAEPNGVRHADKTSPARFGFWSSFATHGIRAGGFVRVMSLCLLATACNGADYYFNSKTGNDTSGSGAIAAPWRTISKMNSRNYLAGDRILLSGDAFSGPINVPPYQWGGTAGSPITITSYGGASATITT